MADKKSVFETLNAINVNDHTEKKNNLTYLSWAWAWAECKKNYPDAQYTVYENADGWNYFTDGKTCWVKTGVTIEGLEHIEYLPVMDFRNKSIALDNVTSFDVNKTIQRSLTKALARHGLGLYIYAGEDLPEGEEVEVSTGTDTKTHDMSNGSVEEAQAVGKKLLSKIDGVGMAQLNALLEKNSIKAETILGLYNVKELGDLSNNQLDNIKKNITKIKARQEEKK